MRSFTFCLRQQAGIGVTVIHHQPGFASVMCKEHGPTGGQDMTGTLAIGTH